MGLFYKVSDKELLSARNKIFKDVGIPALERNGFIRRPFKTSWFGEYYSGIQGYIYEFGRISKDGLLEIIDVYIVRGDSWIKININIFKLFPSIETIAQLNNNEGTMFGIPPNSITKMRLRIDDYKGPPLFYMVFLPEHKLGTFYTKQGFDKEVTKLKELIEKDMTNIDSFVQRWHELHKPAITDWKGYRKD